MERDFENRFHHGSPGIGNRHTDEERNNLRDGDFGREYENRYRSNDGRNRMNYNEYDGRDRWSENSSGPDWNRSRAKRGYGVDNSAGSGYGYDSDRKGNEDTPGRRNQGGYGTGRMGGYSGSGFGGTNYSSHGSFSGDSDYGSMSGGGGNMTRGASSSGYGGGYRNQGSASDRSSTNYNAGSDRAYGSMGSNVHPRNNSYKGYGSNNWRSGSDHYKRDDDRGGYINYDPNNRWNS